MHGRKKVSIDEAEKIKAQQKAKKIKLSVAQVMESRGDEEKEKALIATKTPILDYLDDFASLWNMRKQEVLKNPTKEVVDEELQISTRVLMSNPKSYWAWHHRRWCIDLIEDYDAHSEVELCAKFIAADSRNFHAWRHRRWAVAKCGDMADKELENTTKLIEYNFSNFSAWHYRSQLEKVTDYEEEIQFAQNAFWTDANDQSSWIYYRWLLSRPTIASNTELLQTEFASMEELIDAEPKCKYPLLAAIWIQRKLPQPDEKRIAELIEKLVVLDPIRAPYYREQ
ncbi:prenyltransferase alpha subunit [Tritrichomonas foetus]|uniref:Geranylgeranyl transferase type-2 subunit alpha n=1 Tax=Tritrichomonas foetus TaxID=1144522 RepID=A0A1J4JDU4_9EUKA|nr:prenyltransferase alpha subunit [Tritrichomonas foetus]|eukprot:OHS96825.1 prenyltransferase alpha subunit [Tritrichomonas foetus]